MRHWIHLGTQKAGSSFLRGLVAQVRHIGLADRQELNFFGFEENHSYEAYLARFPQQRPILFENSPIYFRQGSKCAAPFAETMGDKDPFLSIFLRDPVEAIVSHHNMQLLQGFFAGPHDYIGDPRDLRAFIRNNPHYLDRCRYMDLLERHWLTRFPRESFGICTFEEFTAEPVQVLRQLAPWAGLDDTPDIEPDGVPTNARPSSPLSHWLLEATNGGAMRALRRRAMASPALRQLAEATLFAKPKVHQADEDLRSLKAEIAESFRGDVVRLCEFLGRHSLPWKNFFDIDLAPTRGDSQPRQSVRATATLSLIHI